MRTRGGSMSIVELPARHAGRHTSLRTNNHPAITSLRSRVGTLTATWLLALGPITCMAWAQSQPGQLPEVTVESKKKSPSKQSTKQPAAKAAPVQAKAPETKETVTGPVKGF